MDTLYFLPHTPPARSNLKNVTTKNIQSVRGHSSRDNNLDRRWMMEGKRSPAVTQSDSRGIVFPINTEQAGAV